MSKGCVPTINPPDARTHPLEAEGGAEIVSHHADERDEQQARPVFSRDAPAAEDHEAGEIKIATTP